MAGVYPSATVRLKSNQADARTVLAVRLTCKTLGGVEHAVSEAYAFSWVWAFVFLGARKALCRRWSFGGDALVRQFPAMTVF
jgi:hypothetical protein